MPRIIFINRVYWPSAEATAQILRDLTIGLAATGTSVIVITDTPIDPELQDNVPNLKVYRTGNRTQRKLGIVSKLLGYARFIDAAKITIKKILNPDDRVVAMTDPPMLGPKIGPTVRRSGGKIWHWSQDVYPEVALAIKPFGHLTNLMRILIPHRNREWAQSSGIVAIGSDMADCIAQTGISRTLISISPNWSPINLVPQSRINQRERWEIQPDKFLLTYSGNLGRAHTLNPLIDLVRLLQPNEQVETLIVGNGPQRATLIKLVSSQNLRRCHFKQSVPISELESSLAAADVHVITMRPDCVGTVWPSKFYGVISVSRPMIFIGPKTAEIAQLITHHQLGIAVEPTNLEAAQQFVERLCSDPSTYDAFCLRVGQFAHQQPGRIGAVQFWNGIVASS